MERRAVPVLLANTVCFNLFSIVLNWHSIWLVGGLYGLSPTMVHWSSHQPNAINTWPAYWQCACLHADL